MKGNSKNLFRNTHFADVSREEASNWSQWEGRILMFPTTVLAVQMQNGREYSATLQILPSPCLNLPLKYDFQIYANHNGVKFQTRSVSG